MVSLTAILILLAAGCSRQPQMPLARDGVMDLAGWDLEAGPVKLNGEWAFTFGRLLGGDDPLAKNGRIQVPGLWEDWGEGGIQAKGIATYGLTVTGLPQGGFTGALLIPDILSVGRVWINGTLAASSGTLGRNQQEEQPDGHTLVPLFDIRGPTLSILIQVSNFHNARGGINTPVWLGTAQAVHGQLLRQRIITAVQGAALLAMALFHLVLFRISPKERAHLYFGLYCLAWSCQVVFGLSGGLLGDFLLPGLAWRLSIDITLAAYALTPPLMVMVYHAVFPKPWSRWVNAVFGAFAAAFLMYLWLTPGPNAFDRMALAYFWLTIAALFYLFAVLGSDLSQKRPGAWILFPGCLLLAFTIANDMLGDLHLIQSPDLTAYGSFGFILSYSVLISWRFSRTMGQIHTLSDTLTRKNKELAKLDRLKDQLLANTSHELKTPLNGIMGMAQSFAGTGLPPRLDQGLKIIEASARRLLCLINDLLDLSRLKSRDISLSIGPVCLTPVADAVLRILAPAAGDKPLTLENQVPKAFPLLKCDESRLHQILFNLAGNAVKFTDQGEVAITASVSGSMARICISDTGPGIPDHQVTQIFKAFERGRQDRPGTGLGLAITQDLVALNQGELGVESISGQGAIFWFTIPLWPEDQPVIQAPGPSPSGISRFPDPDLLAGQAIEDQSAMPAATRILVVEDDPINRQVIANHLAANEISALPAVSGEQALDLLKTPPLPDMVLMDVMMPGLDGYETCRRIREHHPPLALPVILITAKDQIRDMVSGFEAGANDYLTKPFDKEELMARVKTHIRLGQAYAALRENRDLKQELAVREKQAYQLRLAQRRLSAVLNSIGEAVLGVNPGLDISFANQPFETLTGLDGKTLLGQPVARLFQNPGSAAVKQIRQCIAGPATAESGLDCGQAEIKGGSGRTLLADISLRRLALDQEEFCLMIFRQEPADTGPSEGKAARFIDILGQNRERLMRMETLLQAMTRGPKKDRADIHQGITAIDRILDELAPARTEPGDQRRALIIQVMNLALDYWTAETRTTRVELAEQSGLWNVYIGKDGWARTQTLDKYLTPETLPARPRWKTVINTADFALAACTASTPLRQSLEHALERLRQTV